MQHNFCGFCVLSSNTFRETHCQTFQQFVDDNGAENQTAQPGTTRGAEETNHAEKVDDVKCTSDFHEAAESLYRANFYEALDTVACQIETHFSENNLSTLKDTESVLLDKLH